MAHGIDTTVDARGAFISRQVPAWHKLGEIRPEWTMAEILAQPGIGYSVELQKIHTEDEVEVPQMFATVRTDTRMPLGIVGNKYTVLQHKEECQLFDDEFAKRGFIYETAGVLHGGAQVFLVARRPETWEVAPGDGVKEYVLLNFSYDGRSTQRVKFCDMRTVCANTLAIALNEQGTWFDYTLRHTTSIEERMAEVRESLAGMDESFDRFRRQADVLVSMEPSKSVISQTILAVINEAFGQMPTEAAKVKGYRDRVEDFHTDIKERLTQPNQLVGGIEGTSWSLYNAISEWTDHVFAVGSKGSERARAERRFTSVLSGHAHAIKQAAWRNLLQAA